MVQCSWERAQHREWMDCAKQARGCWGPVGSAKMPRLEAHHSMIPKDLNLIKIVDEEVRALTGCESKEVTNLGRLAGRGTSMS